MRKFERYDKSTKQWEEVEFQDLKINDIFRIFDNNERYFDPETDNNIWVVDSNPYCDLKTNELKVDTLY